MTMRQSESIGKLFSALAVAQAAMDDAVADSENSHFRSKYADLASVRAAIRKPLAAAGLAFTQLPRFNRDTCEVEVETMLVHGETGEYISETLCIPCSQRSAHAIGSATTYGRRFALMAMLGIAPAEDDDGNAASDAPPSQDRRQSSPRQPPKEKPAPKNGAGAAAAPRNTAKTDGANTPPAAPPADGQTTAETLLAGIPHHEGLRDIVRRINAATKAVTAGKQGESVDTLNAAYKAWERWMAATMPQLSPGEQAKVFAAMEHYGKVANKLDAAVKAVREKQKADASAAGASPDDGTLPDYELAGDVS